MTPKEKAIDLVQKLIDKAYSEDSEGLYTNIAKKAALIAVDEILKTKPGFPYPDDVGLEINGIFNIINYPTIYWQEVKQEIELL